MNISEVTRRNIIDTLRIHNINWSGRLSEVDFLGRLYDLKQMKSFDFRFSNAARDIYQHRINNFDWENDWVYDDPRFNLLRCEDEAFLAFLCEMVHPIVRSDVQEINYLLKMFNDNLAVDGWEIVEAIRISDRPVFTAKPLLEASLPQVSNAKEIAVALSSEYLSRQITRMETAINQDTELAIGTAKEFVESICKTILSELGEKIPKSISLTDLVKQVRSKLHLISEDDSKGSETIKRLLSNLGSVVQGLAELRSLYGSGHGKEITTDGLLPRHARLAVGAATTLGVFLYESYQGSIEQDNP